MKRSERMMARLTGRRGERALAGAALAYLLLWPVPVDPARADDAPRDVDGAAHRDDTSARTDGRRRIHVPPTRE